MKFRAAGAVFVLLIVSTVSAASAADDRTASVGGTVSALDIDSDTALSFSGAFEFRFNRVVGLELDATLAPTLKSAFPNRPVTILSGGAFTFTSSSTAVLQGIFPTPTFTNTGGRAVIFSNNVRVAIPTTAKRLEPYFVAGGGISSVRHTADLVYNPIVLAPNQPAGVVAPVPGIRTITQHVTSSSIDAALTLGGGLSVRTMSALSIDADLRLIRLLGNEDRNVGRFGVGARYRF
jgi:opacity protein-like surface antigen